MSAHPTASRALSRACHTCLHTWRLTALQWCRFCVSLGRYAAIKAGILRMAEQLLKLGASFYTECGNEKNGATVLMLAARRVRSRSPLPPALAHTWVRVPASPPHPPCARCCCAALTRTTSSPSNSWRAWDATWTTKREMAPRRSCMPRDSFRYAAPVMPPLRCSRPHAVPRAQAHAPLANAARVHRNRCIRLTPSRR